MFNDLHKPVMISQVLDNLPKNIKICVDGTLGHAGHTLQIAEFLKKNGQNPQFFGYDRDDKMLEKAKQRLKGENIEIQTFNESYANISQKNIDYILLDIGVNMEHFKDEARGFSIKLDGPLDMRFDTNQTKTAKDIVNGYSKQNLINILKKRGDFDDKRADWIAGAIVEGRDFQTTNQLANFLRNKRVNEQKLAVVFQCLRIETNGELDELGKFLSSLNDILSNDGICHIITYHSIEDRQVKQFITQHQNLEFVTKHVLKPSYQETLQNKAARSAKLRIIKKIK